MVNRLLLLLLALILIAAAKRHSKDFRNEHEDEDSYSED